MECEIENIELTIPTIEGELELSKLVEKRVLQAQPDIVAAAVREWLKFEKEIQEQVKRTECPKEKALILYIGAKILLHRLKRLLENESHWYGRGNSPIEKRYYETEKISVEKQGEYYVTECECGQHRTKPKHREWIASRGFTRIPSANSVAG